MALLTISPKRKQIINLPHYLLINGQLLGLMKGEPVNIQLPGGDYEVTIRSAYKFIGGMMTVRLGDGEAKTVVFSDREKFWNWLFNLDLVLWIIKRFMIIPESWDSVYEIASNGFFAIWLLRIWIIRKRYFRLEIM
jgi:hypothetical protein